MNHNNSNVMLVMFAVYMAVITLYNIYAQGANLDEILPTILLSIVVLIALWLILNLIALWLIFKKKKETRQKEELQDMIDACEGEEEDDDVTQEMQK